LGSAPPDNIDLEVCVAQQRLLERAKLFFFRYFERSFVLLLVFAMVGIHLLVDQKFAFLSFYYLPLILAGFYGGRRFAVMAGVFVVALVFFYQYVQGLDMLPGFYGSALLALVPWAGFLILTGYVVGGLAEQREARLAEVKNAYLATLELLAYHIESTERHQLGHSNRVADVAAAIGRELGLPSEDVENLRVAALLHEVGTRDQRLLRLLSRSVTDSAVTVARAMRGAAEIIGEYGHYYEIVGEDWDIEALPIPLTVKILAVADAFETLQMATPVRAAFPKWSALEEVEKGAGKTFAKDAVRALRVVAGTPEVTGLATELKVV
jgi:HD domain-containing protein